MSDQEYKTRITFDYDDANVRRATEDTQELGEQTGQAGDAAQSASQSTREQSEATTELGQSTGSAAEQTREHAQETERSTGALGRMGSSIGSVVTGFLSFTAIAGTVIRWISRIRRESEDAAQAMRGLGELTGDLAVNMGEATDALVTHANQISATEPQRDGLVQFAAALTDIPGFAADPDAVQRMMDRAAPVLEVAPRTRGADLAEVMLALEAEGFDRPHDAAAFFLGGGMEAQNITRILQRGGAESLQLAFAAGHVRPMDARRIRQQLPQMLRRLEETDPETGELAEDLEALGITEAMDPTQRIMHLGRVFQRSPRAQQRVRDVLGDAADEFLPALSDAVETGTLADVRRDLHTTTAAEMAEQRRQSDMVRQADAQAAAEFTETLVDEDADAGRRAQLLRMAVSLRRARGLSVPQREVQALSDRLRTETAAEEEAVTQMARLLEDDPEMVDRPRIQRMISELDPERLERGLEARDVNVEINVIANQYNQTDSPETGDMEGVRVRD